MAMATAMHFLGGAATGLIASSFGSERSASYPQCCRNTRTASVYESSWKCNALGPSKSSVYRSAARQTCCCLAETQDESFISRYAQQLPDWLLQRSRALGFEQPTPVQARALGPVLSGQDALILAQTGSGKTLAYMLPLLASLRPASSVQALVLLPTRELASQVALVARRLAAGSPTRLLVMALLDGSGARRQRKWIVAQPPQVIVGNVEQVDALLSAGLLQLSSLRMLVIDEVDACLDDTPTREALNRMLASHLSLPSELRPSGGGRTAAAPARTTAKAAAAATAAGKLGTLRQTLFVSASLPQHQHFLRQSVQKRWCASRPVLLHADPNERTPPQVVHQLAVCEASKRFVALRFLLRRHAPTIERAIVFLKFSRPVEQIQVALAGCLEEAAPAVLSEETSVRARAEALRAFRDGSRRLLLSTPLGARGLDVPECTHVYLFDVPQTPEAYLHAAGRCGRLGRPGTVTALCSEKELFVVRRIGNALNIEFEDARDTAQSGHAHADAGRRWGGAERQ